MTLPSSKFSIKSPAKCKTSIYVLIEICLQWSKWLGPLARISKVEKTWCIAILIASKYFFYKNFIERSCAQMIYVQCKLIRYRHALKHLEVFQDTCMYCIGRYLQYYAYIFWCLMPSEDKIKLSLIYWIHKLKYYNYNSANLKCTSCNTF